MKSQVLKDWPFEKIPPQIFLGLALLWKRLNYSKKHRKNAWDYAVGLEQLGGFGFGMRDFCWMVRHGLVLHQSDGQICESREISPFEEVTFPPETRFILSDLGRSVAVECASTLATVGIQSSIPMDQPSPAVLNRRHGSHERRENPHWNSETRELSLGKATVKRFRWRASNQEAILSAFQEEGWPARVDDPLAPKNNQCPKRRLGDTIKSLNRKQLDPRIQFHGDGTGQGILWEKREEH